ncbi:MAG: transposase, partial [Burkholderia gladioli]
MTEFLECMHAGDLRTRHVADPRRFSRRRALGFVTLICWFLSASRAAVQIELDRFFAVLAGQAELIRRVSAQALSKVRKHLPLEVFSELNDQLLAIIERYLVTPRWHGLRVVAADASDLRLTSRDATKRVI